MANFLVTSPNLLTEGTNSDDLIVLQSGAVLGATVYGNDGNDLISAIDGGSAFNTIINGNAGADTIALSGVPFTLAKVAGGQDNDLISLLTADGSTFATIHGGKGADTIAISGFSGSNNIINGNEGHDSITLSNVFTNAKSRVSLGKGNDTIAITASHFAGSLIGGAGNDLIGGTFSAEAGFRIEGDSLADPEAVGNDTINVAVTFAGSGNLVQGGFGADVINLSGSIGFSGSTLNGNEGHDAITVSGAIGTNIYLGGGKGNDTITVTGSFGAAFGTLVGGEGNDVIGVSGNSTNGTVIGGAGADSIGLGTLGAANGIQSRYSSFSDSNIAGFDVISAASTGTGSFVIGQTVVTAAIATDLNIGDTSTGFTTNSAGSVLDFGSSVGSTLTARAEILDQFLVKGQTVSFTAGSNTYVFIQAGAAGSGTDGDFLAQVNASGAIALAGAGSAITVTVA